MEGGCERYTEYTFFYTTHQNLTLCLIPLTEETYQKRIPDDPVRVAGSADDVAPETEIKDST
jgi:hypothetical protein